MNEGYLRAVPFDPITNSTQTWRLVMEDAVSSVDQTMPGILRRAQRLGPEEPGGHALRGVVTRDARLPRERSSPLRIEDHFEAFRRP